ncbi:MAG TPA: hypothetical protein VFW62_08790 [bacterium]|nr:hypothetical protein [bacterium]
MSATSQALKQAREETRAGGDRQAIYLKYRDQVSRPLKLATIIANTPPSSIPASGRILNIALLVLLVLGAIFKALGIAGLLGEGVPLAAMFMVVLLGLIIPVVLIIGVIKWEGQIYALIPILCVLGILRAWMKTPPLEAAFDTAFLIVIAVLALAVKRIVFPQLGWLGVRKNPAGGYYL